VRTGRTGRASGSLCDLVQFCNGGIAMNGDPASDRPAGGAQSRLELYGFRA